MEKTIRLKTEDWLFARHFAYVEGQYDNTPFKYGTFLSKWENKKPEASEWIPYLSIDDNSMFINHRNIAGNWMRWDWEFTRSVRIYRLMQPWKASIYSLFREVDEIKMKRRDKRYFRAMKRQYKAFDYSFCETYDAEYSLILEGKKGNAQIWLPKEWVEQEEWHWILTSIENKAERTIILSETEEPWNQSR